MTSTRAKPRGEVAELTAALQNLCTAGKRSDKELRSQKRDVFKKVISHLSIGMDMSSLFPSMTSCANLSPDDIVLKKMLYLYITHYAAQTPDLALLTINQLHKDCIDQDPTVRGLALRSLCSLRVNNYMEYVTSPVLAGLDDRHPYVRRTAVIGVLKIYHSDASVVMNTGMVERLKQLLRSDSDPQVLANCLHVLPKMEPADKLLNKPLLYSLVNRMKDFNDWAQCLVLQLVSEYKPGSDQEVYEILNSLEDRLGSGNSAVVLALARAFLHLTINMSATHQQVLERIKDPLKSLIGRDDPAITYAVLAHVLLLVQRAPIIFESDYSAFYCRAHDPWYIKQLKMEILSHLASSANCYDIITELTEYTRDAVYPTMAREAVKAVGRIALAVPDAAGIIERLLGLLESHCEVVVCEALVQMKDLLRRYPDMAEVVVSQVMATASGRGEALAPAGVSEPEAKAALIWIIGQFGQHIQDAPYLLEPLVEGFSSEEVAVRLALLTAGAQLFFRRPPEMQGLLGQLLVAGLADSHQDVHDRALLYFRLLRTNVAEAERIINPPLLAVAAFSEGLSQEARNTLFQEMNTLSVIYRAPAATFLNHTVPAHLEEPEGGADSNLAAGATTDMLLLPDPSNALLGTSSTSDLLADEDPLPSGPTPTPPYQGPPEPAAPQGLDMLLMEGGGLGAMLPAPAPAAAASQPSLTPWSTGASGPGFNSRPGGGLGVPAPTTGLGLDLDSLLGLPTPTAPSSRAAPPPPNPTPTPGGYSSSSMAAKGSQAAAGAGLDLLGFGLDNSFASPARPAAATAGVSLQGSGLQQGLDDLLGGLGLQPGGAAAGAAQGGRGAGGAAAGGAPQALSLQSQAKLSPAAFQDKWRSLPPGLQYQQRLAPTCITAMAANNHRDLPQHLQQAYIQHMASGGQPPTYKYYFYGQDTSGSWLLVEMVVHTQQQSADVVIKSDNPALVAPFHELWVMCLLGFGIGGN